MKASQKPVIEESAVLVPGPWQHHHVMAGATGYHTAEIGEGPLILCLHGFPENWWAFRHQMVALAEHGYRVVAIDLRGYGASDKPPRGYDLPTAADDAAAIIRTLGESRAIVIGHGWGGMVGWTLAHRAPGQVRRLVVIGSSHPNRFRAALATSTKQVAASRHLLFTQLPRLPERYLTRDDGAGTAELLRRWSGPGFPDPEAEEYYRRAIQIPKVAHCAAEYQRWWGRSQARPDGVSFAHSMARPVLTPVLQIHGRLDGNLLVDEAAGSGAFAGGGYHWQLLDGVGHFPHEEAPETVNRLITDFLPTP